MILQEAVLVLMPAENAEKKRASQLSSEKSGLGLTSVDLKGACVAFRCGGFCIRSSYWECYYMHVSSSVVRHRGYHSMIRVHAVWPNRLVKPQNGEEILLNNGTKLFCHDVQCRVPVFHALCSAVRK